jgi:hypothetical protein
MEEERANNSRWARFVVKKPIGFSFLKILSGGLTSTDSSAQAQETPGSGREVLEEHEARVYNTLPLGGDRLYHSDCQVQDLAP